MIGKPAPPFFNIYVMPSPDAREPLHDDVGPLAIQSVVYSEDHGDAWPNETFPDRPTVRSHIGITFDRPIRGAVAFTVAVQQPFIDEGNPVNCNADSRISIEQCRATGAYAVGAVVISGILRQTEGRHDYGPVPDVDNIRSFNLNFEMLGSSGSGFVTTRTRAEIRFPWPVLLTDAYMGRSSAGPIEVTAQYGMRDAAKFSWVGDAQPGAVTLKDHLTWRYQVSGDDDVSVGKAPPNPPSALREDLIADNSRQTFIAGVLLGVAGGALIPLLQTLMGSGAHSRTTHGPDKLGGAASLTETSGLAPKARRVDRKGRQMRRR